MATITQNDIKRYVERHRKLQNTADQAMVDYLTKHGTDDLTAVKTYAKALVDKYGEASASLAAAFCEETAEAEAIGIAEACDPAKVSSVGEIAVDIDKAIAASVAINNAIGAVVSKHVKKAALDTSMQYAAKTGRQWAWMPTGGETCAFCIMLASRGFVNERNRTATHIHANCDCIVVTRGSLKTKFGGYNPDKYRQIYDSADGSGSKEKLNAIRRDSYAENKDAINEQKRIAYKRRTELKTDG